MINEKAVNALIWGNLEYEIMETKFSLYVASQITELAKDFVMDLFVRFLDFTHYKCGLVPKLSNNEKAEFDKIGGDFEDRSSWVEIWMYVDRVHDKPYFFRQFVDKNGDEHTACVLMDTFSLFECGMILNKTRLEGESKFSFTEISKEFHVIGKGLPKMLSYFKSLNNAEWAHAHTLVLRPTELAKYLHQIDDELDSLISYPIQALRKEEWKDGTIEFMARSVPCQMGYNEEEFWELLKKSSIKIPSVRFLTFYEYIQDKLTPEIKKEWSDIRDRCIDDMKKMLKESVPTLAEEDLDRAKNSLGKAGSAFEEERYTESIILSYRAVEEFLNAMIKQRMKFKNKIEMVMSKNPDLRKYETKLNFIKDARNELGHTSEVYEGDEKTARFALDVMNELLEFMRSRVYAQ